MDLAPPLDVLPDLRSDRLEDPAPSRSVLLVEDEPRIRSHYARALRTWGFEVRDHGDCANALSDAAQSAPDLSICDLDLPDMTGFEFASALRADARTASGSILVVSGHEDATSRTASYAAGADCFLPKSCSLAELQAATVGLARRGGRQRDTEDAAAVVEAFATLQELRSLVSREHMERSGELAERFGRLLGLDPGAQLVLRRAGMLHDVGKLLVGDDIVLKPGPLTAEERRRMQAHAREGTRLCARFRCLADVLPVVLHHHERWNGTGYPDGLAHTEIPKLARVFQIADVYDALTSARPYKRAMSREEARQVLADEVASGFWDPELTARFLELLDAGLLDEPCPAGERAARC